MMQRDAARVTRRHLGPVLAALALIILAAFPFGDLQGHPHWDKVAWIPFVSPPVKPLDVAANLVMGVPVGLASSLFLTPQVLVAGALVAPVSLGVEWAQLYSHGRFPSATDLVCNVAGAMFAAAVVSATRRRRR